MVISEAKKRLYCLKKFITMFVDEIIWFLSDWLIKSFSKVTLYLYFFESHFSIIQTNLTRKNTIKIFDDVFICLQKPVNLLVKFAHGSADQKIPQSHQIT